MNVIAYTRLSQANPHEGESHAAQFDRISLWATNNGHKVVAKCKDTLSGENGPDDRPGFLEAVEILDEGAAEGVVVSSLDRLARKLTIQEALLATVWRREAAVFEVGMGEVPQDDPADPYRTFVRQVMGAAAQLERALIVKRMADGRRRAVTQGRSIGPAPSFGWVKDPDDRGRMVPDPETYPLVQEAMSLLDNQNTTLREVGDFLTSRTGKVWRPTQVARLRDRYRRYAPLNGSLPQ